MKRLVLLLAAAVVVAGCTAFPQEGGEDRPKRLEVSGPTCTVNGEPCSSVQVTRFSSPRVNLEISNFGDSGVNISIGSNQGREVLVSDCSIYDISGFTVKEKSVSAVNPVEKPFTVLENGETLQMEWDLELPEGRDISRLGYTCPLDFAMEFNQTLETSKQVQVKENQDIPDVSGLSSSTTSVWPVRLNIESPSRIAQERPFVARSFLVNRGNGEVTAIGNPDADRDMTLSFGHAGSADCSNKGQVGMYGAGEREGESFREVCSFTPETVEGSEIHRLTSATEYRYRIDLSGVEISVIPVEGGR